MQESNKSRPRVESISDAEITSAIHYLDPDAGRERAEGRCDCDRMLGIDLAFLVALVGVLAFVWLYMRTT
jgi:hypothetical protein